jgi:hypothetical protein
MDLVQRILRTLDNEELSSLIYNAKVELAYRTDGPTLLEVTYMLRDDKVMAIEALRERSGLDPMEAKDKVDQWMADPKIAGKGA